MTTKTATNWQEANKHFLMTAIQAVQEEIAIHLEKRKIDTTDAGSHFKQKLEDISKDMPYTSSVDEIAERFGLSSFELKIILMCAGMELDSPFVSLMNSSKEESGRFQPSFGMALAAFSDAHWSALSPGSPLRYWHLIEMNDPAKLTGSTLRISERVLHYLTGIQHLDESLMGLVEPVPCTGQLVPSHKALADKIMNIILSGQPDLPLIRLDGKDNSEKKEIAAEICSRLNQQLYCMYAHAMPDNPKELDFLLRKWNREAALGAGSLFIDCTGADKANYVQIRSITDFCEQSRSLTFVGCTYLKPEPDRRTTIFEIGKPSPDEQFRLWKSSLNSHAAVLEDPIRKLVSQFSMSAGSIRKAAGEISEKLDSRQEKQIPERILWQTCRLQSRPGLDDLAQRIEPMADWDDLVLPENQKKTLQEIAMHVRQRSKVYHDWGFASKTSRGLGISALFTGESGTGKTMASEVLADELQLDLYRIDLSQVVNKYIGETEKNLKKIFDAADEGGAILLFDEADALFGKRSDVKDSHDRYANIEVSYLLQRMEAYRGLAILTTNLKTSLDKAFMRRLRFVVQFPFPDAPHRSEIWKRIFPSDTPTENIDVKKLSKLNISGGNIRNIAMNAAFMAADSDEPVKMDHIRRAAKSEYAKLEKPMSTSESGSWL